MAAPFTGGPPHRAAGIPPFPNHSGGHGCLATPDVPRSRAGRALGRGGKSSFHSHLSHGPEPSCSWFGNPQGGPRQAQPGHLPGAWKLRDILVRECPHGLGGHSSPFSLERGGSGDAQKPSKEQADGQSSHLLPVRAAAKRCFPSFPSHLFLQGPCRRGRLPCPGLPAPPLSCSPRCALRASLRPSRPFPSLPFPSLPFPSLPYMSNS